MAWLAVDESGREQIFKLKPYRIESSYENHYLANYWKAKSEYLNASDFSIVSITPAIVLPKNSIEKILGYKMTWEDEPVEVK